MGGGGYADPSGVIAAEMYLGRLSIEKGEWAALAKTGTKDAILFTPSPVFAQRWLKGQHGAPLSVRWRTETVYMSCDGRAAASVGHYVQSDGKIGWYTNLWRRDPKQGFQWTLSHGGPTDKAPAAKDADAGDEITAKVAFCKRRGPRGAQPDPKAAPPPPAVMLDPGQPPPMNWEDKSEDGSLRWRWAVAPDKSRTLDVWMATEDGKEIQVVTDRAAPPGP